MGQHYAKGGFPQHDLVMALTAQDMQIRGRSNVIGYAYLGGVCSSSTRQVTIVEDNGSYNGVGTAAHEIGHLLGAVHDGDYGDETCRAGDYIMSPWSNGAKQRSDCSVKQIRDFVTSRKARCLHNKPSGAEYPELVGGCVSMPILLCLAFFLIMRSDEQKPRKRNSKKKKNKEENGLDRRSTRVSRPPDRFQSNDYRK